MTIENPEQGGFSQPRVTRIGRKFINGLGFYTVKVTGRDGKVYTVVEGYFTNHEEALAAGANIYAQGGIDDMMNRPGPGFHELSPTPTPKEQFEFTIPTPGGTFRAWAEDQERAQEIVAAIYPAWRAVYPDWSKVDPGQPVLDTLTVQRNPFTEPSLLDRLLRRVPFEYSCSLISGEQVHGIVKASDLEKAALKAEVDLMKYLKTRR